MQTLITMLAYDALILFVFMTIWFMVSLAIRRQDIADVLWGAGFIVVVLSSLAVVEEVSLRGALLSVLVCIWGGRLATRIYLRNRGKAEDFRYNKWRREWGSSFALRSFFQVFLLQGVLMLVVMAPLLWVIGGGDPAPFSAIDALALMLWLAGFVIESLADYQLDRFKSRSFNAGRIMQTGLWRYSRHPNYFGEVVMWWAIYLLAVPVDGGWATFFGPLVITFLILKVSGVPLLEEHYRDNAEYQQYKKRTSAFIPLPPRHTEE